MKSLMMLFAAFLIGFTASAQAAAAAPVAAKAKTSTKTQVQNPAAYACPKCYQITKGAGKCTMDNSDKVQLGTYYCPHCMKASGAKAGKCASCGMATVQMTRKYCAKMGGTPAKSATPTTKS